MTISLLWSHFKNTEIGDYKEPEAGDVVVENLGALLLLEQVGGEQPQLHDHTSETGRNLPLQEKETALRRNGQPGTRECGYLGIWGFPMVEQMLDGNRGRRIPVK